MTDMARDLVKGFIRRVTPSEPGEGSSTPASVTIATPKIPEPARDALCARIGRSLEAGRSALGLRRAVTVGPVGPSADDAIWVFIDDRPAAVVDADAQHSGDASWVERTADRLHAILHSRFALLLDEKERAEQAEAIRLAMGDDGRELYRFVPDYLLENGVSLSHISSINKPAHSESTAAAVGEVVLDNLAAPTITLQLPSSTLRRAHGADVKQFPQVRVALYEDTGVQFPDLKLDIVDDEVAPIRLKANDVWLKTGVAGGADWRAVAAAVKAILKAHAPWFIRRNDVAIQRKRRVDVVGSLVELSRATYSDAVVAASLRALVRSGQNVRNLQRVLWLLHDTVDGPNAIRFAGSAADVPTDSRDDPESLAARVRARIADEAWRTNAPTRPGPYLALTAEDGNSLLSSDPARRAKIERLVVATYREAGEAGEVGLAVAPWAAVVAPLRYALGAMAAPPPVVSVQELPLDAPIRTLSL
jgi:hypothetical protein